MSNFYLKIYKNFNLNFILKIYKNFKKIRILKKNI